ncbi:MAG: alpha/beta fold hydrolase [Fibrobacter sp.]|nr:alpha/beta fold hydrolase [Fibrobacter sp.]
MKSLQFGYGDHKLYGVYHFPLSTNSKQKSILICSSVGPEFINTYRLLRNLGEQLAKSGHHVFRFDWYGCGDSWGESTDISISHWITDLRWAAEELINLSGNQVFSVIGLKLGAAIAWCSLKDWANLSSFILWDPIIIGSEWMNQMQALHSKYLAKSPESRRFSSDEEILGFPLPVSVRNEICSLDISSLPPPLSQKIHLLYSGDSKEYEAFCKSVNFPITMEHLDIPEVWISSLLSNHIVMSHPAINSIVGYFNRE